jgi:hypothetical protein
MFETMEVLGKKESLERIEYFMGKEISKLNWNLWTIFYQTMLKKRFLKGKYP